MPDVIDVIKGIEEVKHLIKCENLQAHSLKALLIMDDAIVLLKAQEPVKPIMHYVPDGKRSSAAWQCGNCLINIGYGANYCYNCGRAVKWE